uniref:Rec21/ENK19 domain-containing protein n=1 Tax=Rhinolophus ferrumequinum TaxID=59479 RepID=A0A671DP71_RHIFE
MEKSNLSFQPAHPITRPEPSTPVRTVMQQMRAQTTSVQPPTWGQLKKLAHMAENRLIKKRVPKTDVNMFLSMLAVISVVSCLPLGVGKPKSGVI